MSRLTVACALIGAFVLASLSTFAAGAERTAPAAGGEVAAAAARPATSAPPLSLPSALDPAGLPSGGVEGGRE